MKRLKLIFKATRKRLRFDSQGIRLTHDDTVIVDESMGRKLLGAFPENFFVLEVFESRESTLDEIIEIFNTPSEGLKIRGLYVTKNRKLKVDYQI